MKVKVDETGVMVPKRLLGGSDEVEIRSEEGRVIIEPVRSDESAEEADPIFGLGKRPVSCDVPDASRNHDAHLYGSS